MNEMLMLFSGALLAWMADWIFSFWRRSQEDSRRRDARLILKRHGLTPQLYLAAIGEEYQELRSALDALAFSGYIITDSKGQVVGKLLPTIKKGPHLRLVVSNDTRNN